MFNIWKQAWNYTDKTSPHDSSIAVHNVPVGTETSETAKHPKRSRDEYWSARKSAHKKPRYRVVPGEDSVANYLPETPHIQSSSQVSRVIPIQPTVEDVFEHTKKANTLAVLDTFNKKIQLFKRTLSWTTEQENLRRKRGLSNRVTFLITAPDTTFDENPLLSQKLENFKVLMVTETVNSRAFGQKLTEEDLIVMPANVFLSSLACGGLFFGQMNLLVLPDVDMIGDAHPMARVMREFYNSSPPEERPRIFGIIGSNAKNTISYDIGMLKLEKLLDSVILGVSPELRDAVMALPDKPTEMAVYYDPHFNIGKVDTPLLQQLRRLGPITEVFKKQFKGARYVAYELGTCASDLVWRRTLREMENQADLHLDNEEDDIVKPQDATSGDLEVQKKVYNIIKNWIFALPNLDHTSKGYNVTPKLVKLVQTLKPFESHGENFRGIIFVHRRAVAHALCDILRVLGDYLGFIRPQVLTGHNSLPDSYPQQDILEDFRIGTINVLIATKFAEDLEIPSCTCVIRFNIFESLVSYAYSRASTRGSESYLIHMAERGNDVHRRILSEISMLDISMQQWIESVSNGPESSIPPSTLKETSDPYRSDSDDDEEEDFIQDPAASSRIYTHDATTVLYRFLASSLPSDCDIHLKTPLFKFQQLRGHGFRNMHICTVLMPPDFSIPSITGPPYPTQSAARRAACLRTCEELFNRGILDYSFFPRPPSVTVRLQRTSYISSSMVEDVTDDDDDNSLHRKAKSSGTRSYYRRKADFWSNTSGIFNGRLYPTIIAVDFDGKSTEKYGSLLFLTRLPLPRFESFKLFDNGVPFNIRLIRAAPFEVDQSQLQLLHKYTLRLCRTISNKPFVVPLEETLYFLAPLSSSSTLDRFNHETKDMWSLPDVWNHIPWDSVISATKNWAIALRRESTESLVADIQDAIIQDRWVEFTRRYYALCLRPDFNPMSKPDDSTREFGSESFLEYCQARRKGFQGLEDNAQPLLEVDRVPAITNLLNPSSKTANITSKKGPVKYLIPELCCKLTVPASIIRTALLLPSITRRLDDVLLVKELNAKLFDHCIDESLLHEAISTPSVSVEYDYERLELLGDAYLKYLSSVYLFVTQPSLHEGALHIARQRIISNRSLLKNANRSGLPQYIQSKPFASKTWVPLNFKVFRPPKPIVLDEVQDDAENIPPPDEVDSAGRTRDTNIIPSDPMDVNFDLAQEPVSTSRIDGPGKDLKKKHVDFNTQKLGDKAVADVAEAVIGAAYITMGREVALKVTKALNIPVPHIDRWTDFARKTLAPPPEAFAPLKPGTVEHIEKAIGHPFKRPHLLAQALTHASIQGHETTSYERLEFIGDAILDFLVIRYIFDRDGNLSPGILTLLKSAMVANSTLAAVCVHSGFHEYLIFESQGIASSIAQYSDALLNAKRADEARATLEGRIPGQYWLDIEQPKVLSDVLESVMGAVYVSDNFSPAGVEAFFDNILKPFFEKHITLKTLSHHPTKILFELFQSIGCQEFMIDKYLDPEKPGMVTCDVVCHDIILAAADDPATQLAARKASFLALDALEGDAEFLARTCSCRLTTNAKKKAKSMQQQMMELEDPESDIKP